VASAGTLREFLIALGFSVDQPGLAKFETSIGRATKSAVGLGEAVFATAAAIEIAVVRIGRQFEDLYYLSQRTGASVAALQAWQYGAQQVGIAADASRSAIDSFARSLRNQPGNVGLLHLLGVQTQGRTTDQMFNDLVDRLAKLKPYIAALRAQQFGQDPDTMYQLELNRGVDRAAQADISKRQSAAGFDPDKWSKSSVDFVRDLNKLESEFGILADRIGRDFMPWADKFVNWLDGVVQIFNNWDNTVGDWASWVGTIATTAMGAWIAKAFLMRTAALGLSAGLAGVASSVLGIAALGGAGAALLATIWPQQANAGEDAITAARHGAAGGSSGNNSAIVPRELRYQHAQEAVARLLATIWPQQANAGEDAITAARHGAAGGSSGNNPGNMRPPGASTGYQKFPTMLSGLSEMARQLLVYGDRGLTSVSSIVSKWAPPRENNTAAYIADVSARTGFSADQQLNLRDPTTLQRLMDAMIRHETGKRGDPAIEMAAINARLGLPNVALAPGGSGGGVTINQKTDIVVSGVSDPKAAGAAVLAGQARTNANIVRNLAGVIR